uniref:Allantoicase n=1 Tax=Sexangularia sp. CB-2014 TaxID=1486929 RepID=A0A7S1VT55_9EUKA
MATTERSRWEVWAELAHGRFPLHRYLTLVHEEFRFIRDFVPANVPADAPKRPAVLWDEGTAAWYAIARRILLLLTTSREPVEFATELLIPFTTAIVRNAADPWATALSLGGANLRMRPEVARADAILERLPVDALVEAWDPLAALTAVPPVELAGALAAGRADSDDSALGSPLARATARVQAALRVADPSAAPLSQAWLDAIVRDFGLTRGGLQVAFAAPGGGALHSLASGDAIESPATLLQCASLSKPVAVALALELLTSLGVRPTDKVNQVAAEHGSSLRIAPSPGLGDDVTIQHCMSHTALDQHYVFGFPLADQAAPGVPPVLQLIAEGSSASVGGSYEPVVARVVPGSRFQYSGAGFVVLHALIEVLAGVPLAEAAAPFTDALTAHLPGPQPQLVLTGESRLRALARGAAPPPSEPAVARGTLDDGSPAPVLSFPPCAAGGLASARGIAAFLAHLTAALSPAALAPLSPTARSTMPISHDTALLMTAGTNRSLSPAVQAFMAAEAGVGIFVAEAGLNTVLLHQAANEGYRGVFAWVASGPEAGAGIVVLASGDNGAVPALAEVTRSALLALGVSGFDPSSLPSPRMGFDTSALPQETIVNRGLRDLVFAGFQRRRPPLIAIPGRPAHPYTALDLMRGASVVSVTDDRFAQAINLVDQAEPIFDPAAFTEAGKEMDSWESQRHNPAPDVGDVATYQLVAPAVIRAVEISTKWHDGNQAVACAIRGRRAADQQWFDLLPASPLQGHAWHRYLLPESAPVDLVAVHNIPDGGISRLRCYAAPPDASWVPGAGRFPDAISSVEAATKLAPDPAPDAAAVARNWARVPSDALVNVASVGLGASVIAVSNQHYGPAAAILASTEPRGMFDGFETARGRGDGAQEFVEIALGAPASLVAVDVDMTFFRNNNPASLSVAFSAAVSGEFELRPRSTQSLPVKHYRGNTMRVLLQREAAGALGGAPVRRVRIESRPCGGFNRVRVWGRPVAEPVARL